MEARARGISVAEGKVIASGFDNLLLVSRAKFLGEFGFLIFLRPCNLSRTSSLASPAGRR